MNRYNIVIKNLYLPIVAVLLSPLSAQARAPKLVVILVGDQVRADYLERFHDDLAPDGLRRFRDQGSYYLNARVDQMVTKTSPGHVLIGSGIYAARSGVVSNEWYDRASSRTVSPAEIIPDATRVKLRWFTGTSFAQRLHKEHPGSRMVSVSLKDRGALLFGGPDQDEAYWCDQNTKQWVSYHPPSDWLKEFSGQMSERKPPVTEALADGLTEELAERIVSHWKLGTNPSGDPDVLTVSFSAVDLVGHQFGPDSPEVREAFLRLDQAVSKLTKRLEKTVGHDIVYAFSADHGVTPLPEISKTKRLDAGRVQFTPSALPDQESILAVSEPWVYTLTTPSEKIIRDLSDLPGVAAVYTAEQIAQGPALAKFRRSYYPGRCGDLWVVLKPHYIFSSSSSGTTHGQPTDDDQRVPMGFYGLDVPAHVFSEEESVSRIAPTLLKRLGIVAPDLKDPLSE